MAKGELAEGNRQLTFVADEKLAYEIDEFAERRKMSRSAATVLLLKLGLQAYSDYVIVDTISKVDHWPPDDELLLYSQRPLRRAGLLTPLKKSDPRHEWGEAPLEDGIGGVGR